ncbi:NAD(P)/FAD-dependent oxidoreductase [Patescibacteria group bacterium]|nr:NAD(P)/FAD-dependent oxidoreductase [Patescibacteria group bacterium]
MKIYDLLIIGAGPAGLIAGARASELGASVLILEKNAQAGTKLLMTGGGRCNLTNLDFSNIRDLASRYQTAANFLLSPFSRFGPKELCNFFEEAGLKLKEEARGRVFPESNKARSVLDLLLKKIKDNDGEVLLKAKIKKIVISSDSSKKIEKVELEDGRFFKAKNFLIATGGKSYPLSGSSGDAYAWLKKLGHTIIEPHPGLAPIKISENFIKDLEGLSFSNLKISLKNNQENNKDGKEIKTYSEFGDLIFGADNISGPAVLNLSRLVDLKSLKNTLIEIDFFPDSNLEELNKKLQNIFHSANKNLSNALTEILPPRFVKVFLNNLKINLEKKANSVSKEEKELISRNLKYFKLKVANLYGFDKAMITRGGLSLKEVFSKNFKSKLFDNLYFAGEVLDIDGPTGGYNLQIAWTIGYLVAEDLFLK